MVKGFKSWLEDNSWDDWFGDLKTNKKTVVDRKPPQTSEMTLELYRGFNADWNEIHREGDFYVLSPKRSEQGMLWFTHKFVNHYNPVEYAASHGEYFLTYPLKCKTHFETLVWSDGSTSIDCPENIRDKYQPSENSQYLISSRFGEGFYAIELPQGWVFTYKMEKFIGCSQEIRITRDMVKKSAEVWRPDED